MAIIADSFFDAQSTVIKELIGDSVQEFMPDTTGAFRDMILGEMATSNGQDILGRDLKFKLRFAGTLTGVIEGGNTHGKVTLYGDQTQDFGSKMMVHEQSQTWPNPLRSASAKPYGMTGELRSFLTELPLPVSMLRLDAIEANIKQHLVPHLRGFGRQIALLFANQFWARQDQSFRLGSLGTSSNYTIDATNFTITFAPTEKSTYRFSVGQPVEIWADASTIVSKADASSSPVLGFVSNVDHWGGQITIQFDPRETAENGAAATFATWATTGNLDNAFVVYAKTNNSNAFEGLYSIWDWLKTGTTGATDPTHDYILGDAAITTGAEDFLNVRNHAQFRSGKFDVSGALTRNKLLSYLQTAFDALNPYGYTIDSLFASRGVFLNMFDQQLSRETIMADLGGSQVGSLRNMGLQDGFSITFEGQTIEGMTERFLEDGNLVGFRRKNNWQLLSPQEPAGASSSSGKGDIDKPSKIPLGFLMPLVGHDKSIFPLLDGNGNPTDFARMPGYINAQYVPINQIPGFWLENITTTREFSDTV